MKTAGQIDGYISCTGGQFAQCLALNEPPVISRKSLVAVNVFDNDFYMMTGIQPLLQGRI